MPVLHVANMVWTKTIHYSLFLFLKCMYCELTIRLSDLSSQRRDVFRSSLLVSGRVYD